MGLINGEENKSANPVDDKLLDTSHPPKNATRTLHVAWKHRETRSKPYKQMSGLLGGVKKATLDRRMSYSFDEIKELCLATVKNKYNKDILKRCTLELSNFQEQIFKNFSTVKNKNNADFWVFLTDKLKTSNSQFKIYLLATEMDLETTVNEIDNSKSHKSNKYSPNLKVDNSQKHIITIDDSSSEINNGAKRKLTNSVYTGTVIKYTKKTTPSRSKMDQSSQSSLSVSNSSDISEKLRFSIPSIDQKDIKFSETILGSGTFGSVILSTWNNTDVAVKKMKTPEDPKYIYREINVMDKVRHPNLILIMAVSFTQSYIYIIMEYFKSTNLAQFISTRNPELDYEVKKSNNYLISYQMCQAIAFLHGFTPYVLHKDLKPENILINDDFIIKICDFGLSKLCDGSSGLNTTVGHHFHGTPMYMAPEILLHNSQGDAPADIWALACCIVELFTEKKVWDVKPKYTLENLRQTVKVQKQPYLDAIPTVLHDTLNKCFDHQPVNRPIATMLVKLFKRLNIRYD